MEIIPVIDLLNGVAVHGIGGKRSEYRPLKSEIAVSPDPSVVLRAYERLPQVTSCYIADLDAIQKRELNRCVLAELARSRLKLIVDRGVRTSSDVEELFDLGIEIAVVALESLPELQTAADLVSQFGSRRMTFSLDLKNGRPLAANDILAKADPLEILADIVGIGFSSVIILDLADVGAKSGLSATYLCARARRDFPDVSVITGGGIRSVADLQHLRDLSIDGVLLASALHNATISAHDLDAL